MARKKATAVPNGDPAAAVIVDGPDSSSNVAAPIPPPPTMLDPSLLEPVKINNYNLSELKNTCDDMLKKLLSQPNSFQQQHTHTDIRLTLGYLSILIAAGTALYGWKIDFEKSKPVVTVGVALYFLLTTLQAAYIYLVEKNVVFVGKRKTVARRIETERLTVSSKTLPSTPASPPQYSVELVYFHSANGGKALLKRGKESGQEGYNAFFDAEGNMRTDVFGRWVEGLVVKATSS